MQRLPASVALHGAGSNKRAEAVARNIFATIVTDGMTPGTFLGSEATLMAQQQASRGPPNQHIVASRRPFWPATGTWR